MAEVLRELLWGQAINRHPWGRRHAAPQCGGLNPAFQHAQRVKGGPIHAGADPAFEKAFHPG